MSSVAGAARRSAHGIAVLAVVASSVAGCASSPRTEERCVEADRSTVRAVMSGAVVNTRPASNLAFIDHVEAERAFIAALPAGKRDFGATRLLALRMTVFYGGESASPELPGFEATGLFFIDDSGSVIGSTSSNFEKIFTIDSPDDPRWRTWTDRVAKNSRTVFDLLGCAKP